ncbi:MAG: PH domain-containing protein [Patescibacteria group bacterium]
MTNFQKSALQTQYPLSPRKFWKKIVQKVFPIVISVSALILAPTILFFSGKTKTLVNFNGKEIHIFNYLLSFSILVWFLIILFTVIVYAFYVRAYIRRYYYDAGESFVTIKKGVFTPTEIHVQYGKIQDVYVDQDLLDRMMGLYDVHIASATVASGIEAHIDGVNQIAAEGLKSFLLSKISGQVLPTDQSSQTTVSSSRATFSSSEEISSNTYPISSRFLPARFFSGLLWFAVLFLFFAIPILSGFVIEGWSLRTRYALYVLGIICFSLYVWRLIYLIIWKKNFRFAFLPDFIRTDSSVINKSEKQLPYSSVQDVMVRQGLFDRLFGICSVFISNASRVGLGIVLPGQSLEKGNEIANILKNSVLSADRSKTGL